MMASTFSLFVDFGHLLPVTNVICQNISNACNILQCLLKSQSKSESNAGLCQIQVGKRAKSLQRGIEQPPSPLLQMDKTLGCPLTGLQSDLLCTFGGGGNAGPCVKNRLAPIQTNPTEWKNVTTLRCARPRWVGDGGSGGNC